METPDRTGREAILKVHVSKKELPLGDDIDLRDIASMTTGFTGYNYYSFSSSVQGTAIKTKQVEVNEFFFSDHLDLC